MSSLSPHLVRAPMSTALRCPAKRLRASRRRWPFAARRGQRGSRGRFDDGAVGLVEENPLHAIQIAKRNLWPDPVRPVAVVNLPASRTHAVRGCPTVCQTRVRYPWTTCQVLARGLGEASDCANRGYVTAFCGVALVLGDESMGIPTNGSEGRSRACAVPHEICLF
jgi:hypothetical protein